MDESTRARSAACAFSLLALLLAGCNAKPAADTSNGAAATPPLAAMTIPLCINGECAVLDQHGAVRVNADNPYDAIVAVPLDNTFIAAIDGLWSLHSGDGKQVIKADFTDQLRLLTPGYFGFAIDDKFGIIDQQGKVIQAPAWDSVFPGMHKQFIAYEVNDKLGFLSPEGRVITQAEFDDADLHEDPRKRGDWITAVRGELAWAVNLNTGVSRQVDFDAITDYGFEHLVVKREDKKGLADAKGNLLTEIRYEWLGTPGDGLVAFRERHGGLCGYLDYQGKVAIAPSFSSCEPFGHKGAFAVRKDGESGSPKAGLIARNGDWLVKPVYDWAGQAGHSFMGMVGDVPGYAGIGVRQSLLAATFGLFDTHKGVELFKPVYAQIGVLNADRFVFAKTDSPMRQTQFLGMPTPMRSVGVMDAKAKVLIEPGQFVQIKLDDSGRYLRALQDTSPNGVSALYDLQGKQLVPAQWQEQVIDQARGAIFVYEVQGPVDDQQRDLRAVYRLDGTLQFQVRDTECGAQQVVDGSGKALWPLDAEQYCPEPEPQPAAKSRAH